MTDTTQPGADALDLDKLEALARAATPGDWTYFPKPKYNEHHVSVPIEGSGMKLALFDDGCHTERPEADARYIAAANPAAVLALIALARRAAQPVEAAVQQARNVAFEAAASLCDRFAARDMHPAECAGAIRMMKSALDKLAAAHPSEPAVPAVGCARLAHDGSEHPPKELRGFAGLIEVEYHNGSKERKKVGAIDWHRVVAYVAGPVGGALVSPGGVASEQIEKLALKHAAWRSTGPKFGVLFYADSLVRFVNDIAAPTGSAAAPADLTPTQERWLEIGQAVERACEFLPEGFDLHIELEHHAGSVRLYLRDDDASLDEFEADTFGGKINEAIDFATNQPIPTGEKA